MIRNVILGFAVATLAAWATVSARGSSGFEGSHSADDFAQQGWTRTTIDGVPISISPLESDPDAAAMETAALDSLDQLIVRAIADSASPGVALAIGRGDRLVRLRGYGTLDWDASSEAVTPGTLFDLASLTKVVGTTTAVMVLVEEGRVDLERPVAGYLPWWIGDDPRKADVTVRDLLLHRGGLPPFRAWWSERRGADEFRAAIAAEPLQYAPGTETVYSDIGFMTLSFLVEEVSGSRLDRFLDERVWSRLGMEDTGFNPPESIRSHIAPTEVDTVYRMTQVQGEVHDENAYAMGGVSGHAGLFSNVDDLATFAEMLLHQGWIGSCVPEVRVVEPCDDEPRAPVLQAQTIREFATRYDTTASRALGWDTPSGRSSAGDYLTSRAFGHTGFTGTSVWIDPELDLFVVLLTNRVNPTRANTKHVPLRRSVHDVAALAITDRSIRRREP